MLRDDDDNIFFDLDAERAVLGAVLLDDLSAGTFARASSILSVKRVGGRDDPNGCTYEGDFSAPSHNVIFACMGEVLSRGEKLDVVTLANELRQARGENGGLLNAVGGVQYLGELTDHIPTTALIESHARIVRKAAELRRADEALVNARKALRGARDPDAAITSALDVMRRASDTEGSTRRGPRPLVEHCNAAWHDFEDRICGGGPAPLTWGLSALDRTIGGLPTGVVVIGGVQGRGKTAFVAQLLRANARRFLAEARAEQRKPQNGTWWTLEMPSKEVIWRHAIWDSGVPQSVVRDRRERLSDDHIEALTNAFAGLADLPIYLDGESSPNVLDIRAWLFANPLTRIAVVDWLGCLQPHPDAPRRAAQHEHAEMNMKVLAATARQLGITIVVPNQFIQSANRGGEQRMHDMLGGASIINDATAILVMRPNGDAMDDDNLPISIRAEKVRNGPNGIVNVIFRRKQGLFVEVDNGDEPLMSQHDERPIEPPAERRRRAPPPVAPAWHEASTALDD